MNDKQLAIQTAPTLAAFDTKAIEDAFRAALPNGQRLSSDQIRAAAIASQTSDLNPIFGEMHVTNTGIMGAAKTGQAKANEFLQANGDFAEWDYKNIGAMSADEIRARLAEFGRPTEGEFGDITKRLYDALDYNPSNDHAIHTKIYLRKSIAEWRHNVQMALAVGATPEEMRREYGIRPRPDYAAWGIVRFKEQKTDPRGKTAQEKWDEMNAKYSPVERAKKRGRTACINALLPVTIDQRRRLGFSRQGGDVVIAPIQNASSPDLGPKWDIVDHPDAVQQTAADIVDAHAMEAAEPGDPPWDDDPVSLQMPIQAPPPLPDRISALFDRLSARRMLYEENGWLNTEKQDNLVQGILKRLCGKDDGLYRSLLNAIAAKEHWGDVSPGRRRAILKDWLKLDAEGKPCAEALADFEEIKKYHATQHNAN